MYSREKVKMLKTFFLRAEQATQLPVDSIRGSFFCHKLLPKKFRIIRGLTKKYIFLGKRWKNTISKIFVRFEKKISVSKFGNVSRWKKFRWGLFPKQKCPSLHKLLELVNILLCALNGPLCWEQFCPHTLVLTQSIVVEITEKFVTVVWQVPDFFSSLIPFMLKDVARSGHRRWN